MGREKSTKSEEPTYDDLRLSNYINTKKVFANLDVTDLVKAAVLGQLNIFLVGNKGTGKSQLLSDIYESYFCGNKKEGGQGVFIRANPETDIHNDIFTHLNLEKGRKETTDSLEAAVIAADELNRTTPVGQNQFFGLGDGTMDYGGEKINWGLRGYHLLIATANLGNGEFQGTFDIDSAMMNRLHISVDFDYEGFKPTLKDRLKINRRKADPNIKQSPRKDLTGKIISASKVITDLTSEFDDEASAIIDYISFSLENCLRKAEDSKGYKTKPVSWPSNCQDCRHNPDGKTLCSLIREPVTRTIEVVKKYTASLYYLARLKDSNVKIDTTDLVFKAFELSGAYQGILNKRVLQGEHDNQGPEMMSEVVDRLKEEYNQVKPYILTAINVAREHGIKVLRFFENGGKTGNYDDLSETAKGTHTKIEPFTNKGFLGFEYVGSILDEIIFERETNAKTQGENL